jgi:hypothetical protein
MEAPGRATYKGLLLRAEKRFSHGFQALGSYAYSNNTGTSFRNGFNLDNWLQSSGPFDFDITQIANLAAVVQLPWRFELGLNFSFRAYRRLAPTSAASTSMAMAPRTTCCRDLP